MRLTLFLLALVAGAAAFFYFYPDAGGRLLDGLHKPDFAKKTDRIYKWRDENGAWQLTDTPPPAGIEFEVSDYREDVNVLPVPPGAEQ